MDSVKRRKRLYADLQRNDVNPQSTLPRFTCIVSKTKKVDNTPESLKWI